MANIAIEIISFAALLALTKQEQAKLIITGIAIGSIVTSVVWALAGALR